MLRIEIAKSINYRGRSLFLFIQRNPDKDKQISKIRELPRYTFITGNRNRPPCWEIPLNRLNDVLNLLDEWDIDIIGDIPKEVKQRIEMEEQITSGDVETMQFKTKPFDHQIKGCEYAKTHDKFILGDEQGLGKTKQSIDIAVSRKSMFKHCLIVCCVNGLKWNWQDEIDMHSNEKGKIIGERITRTGSRTIDGVAERIVDLRANHDEFFLITNIETLRDKSFAAAVKEMCLCGDIGMCIVDEIHKCKNPTSQQGKALQSLQSFFRMGLSGTPLMSSPEDIYQILKWMDAETHSFTDFKDHYCVLGGFGGYDIVGYKNIKELQDRLGAVMLRRKKDEVLNLPPKIRTSDYVEMLPDQKKIYKEVLTQIKENIDKIRLLPNPLTEIIRLRQTTGYPGILSSAITKSAKLQRMAEIVNESVTNGDKVIIFSNWTQVINPAYEMMKELGYDPALITGEVDSPITAKNKFMNADSCKVILGTTSAMGTGYTLTAGRTVIFLDSPWTRAEKDQAEDRAHRIGTTGTVNIITIVCKDTIDEKIETIVAGKGQLSDVIVDKMEISPEFSLFDFIMS